MKIFLHTKRLGVTGHRNLWSWFAFSFCVDYYNIITSVNILTYELTIEYVHYKLHKKHWNKKSFDWCIIRNYTLY